MEPFQLPDGKPEKRGESYTFSNGATYTGTIRNGKMHGYGRYDDPGGGFYEGEWRDGVMHGQGTCIASDGEKYDGEYKDAHPHGKGKYTFQNGNVFEGEYVDGRIEGHGVIKFPDNRRFVGMFKDNKKHGRGRYEGATGVYEGEYRDGKKEGIGIFTWIDGSSYEGPWSEDYMHGENGFKREKDGALFRVHHDMGKLLTAEPFDSMNSFGGAAAGPRDFNSFSDAHLSSSAALNGQHQSSQPNFRSQGPTNPKADFQRTLSNAGPGGAVPAVPAVSAAGAAGPAAEQWPVPPPVAWVREQWGRVADVMGCGGARRDVGGSAGGGSSRSRDYCGGCGYPE